MEMLKKTASLALDTALSLGAQTAQCFVKESETREFNVDGGEFSLFRTLFDRAVSLTVFKDKRKGSVSINKFDEGSVRALAENCVRSAESSSPDEAWEICSSGQKQDFVQGVPVPDTEKLFMRTQELMRDISARHPKILMEQMIVSHEYSKRVYMNTSGNTYSSVTGKYIVSLMFSGHDGEKSSSFYGTDVVLDNLDRPFIECAQFERELSDVEKQIDTVPASGKFVGTVVFTPACLASTLYSVCSNFASDGVLLDGTSIWKDKLNQKVASDKLSISLNPYDKRIICGERYTGEGYLSSDYDVIKDGVLKSFMLSRYVANKTNNEMAKNGSFALVVENGQKPLSEIIAGIDRGLLVGRFSGGNPGANGEFSGVAKNGFLIENGKITDSVSETMISGNLADMLNDLVGISRETLSDGSVVVPYMAFGGITVSGK